MNNPNECANCNMRKIIMNNYQTDPSSFVEVVYFGKPSNKPFKEIYAERLRQYSICSCQESKN